MSQITWKSNTSGKTINISTYMEGWDGMVNIAVGEDNVTIPYTDIRNVMDTIKFILEKIESPPSS